MAAIYLWGYCAEMLLKAAYFSFIGINEDSPLNLRTDINAAINRGRTLGINWPQRGQGHNVCAWSELLILERANASNKAYTVDFNNKVQMYGQRIGQLWNETLRYHKNKPYAYEIRQVQEAAEWFLGNFELL